MLSLSLAWRDLGVCFWLTRNTYTLKEHSWCQHMQNRILPIHADVALTQAHTLSTKVLLKGRTGHSLEMSYWKNQGLESKSFGAPLLPERGKEEGREGGKEEERKEESEGGRKEDTMTFAEIGNLSGNEGILTPCWDYVHPKRRDCL